MPREDAWMREVVASLARFNPEAARVFEEMLKELEANPQTTALFRTTAPTNPPRPPVQRDIQGYLVPHYQVQEKPERFTLIIDLPGASEEEIVLDGIPGLVTIHTEGINRYRREIRIPEQYTVDDAEQEWGNNQLHLHWGNPKPYQPR